MKKNWDFVTPPARSFAGLPICTQLDALAADIAIVGIHYLSPYPNTDHLDHYDFDFDDILLPDENIRLVDCGDVDNPTAGKDQIPGHIETTVDVILRRGAIPIVLGTDEGGAIPVMRAHQNHARLCVVHIDAHIDWRNERDGVRQGYSSVMRRASEMPGVHAMAQIGLRGIGSARRQEVEDARSFGSVFIRAREVHREGIEKCLAKIPAADHYLITIDADALDPSIAPGVLFPSPGGLTFDEVTGLVRGISLNGAIAGINLFEVRPERDINGLTAATASRLIVNFIGTLARGSRT